MELGPIELERGSLSRKTAKDLHKNAIHFYRQTEQRTQLPAKTFGGRGRASSVGHLLDEDPSMKYFSISRGHGECTVIRGALEYLYLYPQLLFEEERERRVAQTTEVERERV